MIEFGRNKYIIISTLNLVFSMIVLLLVMSYKTKISILIQYALFKMGNKSKSIGISRQT